MEYLLEREVIEISLDILTNPRYFLDFLRQKGIMHRNTDPSLDYIYGLEIIFVELGKIIQKSDRKLEDRVFATQLYLLGLQLHSEYVLYLKETNQEMGMPKSLLKTLEIYHSQLNESQLSKLLN